MQKEGEMRIPSGCAISGIFSRNASKLNGENIIKSITVVDLAPRILPSIYLTFVLILGIGAGENFCRRFLDFWEHFRKL